MEAVLTSELFRWLSARHAGVEAWPDSGADGAGWSYFWVVSRPGEGSVRNLAYVRAGGGGLQRRTYSNSGDDEWLPAA